ncbi:MAG: hypothetical protein MAG451_02545 [Anaerolineales bacterium]|nr:hypothetical protein [Anaerolineales bacterium]
MGMGFGLLLVAMAILVVLWDDAVYWLQRIWRFQKARYPWIEDLRQGRLWRRLRRKTHHETDLVTLRDFVLTLQLATSLEDTLAGALRRAATYMESRGAFGERLMVQVRSRLTISPEAVIEGLAEDFDSEELREVMERLDLARDSGLSYADALAVSVEDIENRMRRQIEKDIQRAPLILTIPMVAGVFFSALMLLMYPLVASLISNLATGP